MKLASTPPKGAAMNHRHDLTRTAATLLVVLMLAAGCGAGQTSADGSPAIQGVHQRDYTSSTFVIPFDLTPPDWLDARPHIEQPNFVTWESPGLPAVRLLVPVSVYPPGDTVPAETPSDFLPYLLAQTTQGAHFSDQATAQVGGRPATLLTATVDEGLDGSLGCAAPETAAEDCFGLQPDFLLRMAVVPVRGKNLLIWLRLDKNTAPAEATARMSAFETMLSSITFSDRAPTPTTSETATAVAASPLDGTYTMSISWPNTHTADAKCVGGAEGASAMVVYELALDHGSLRLWVRVGGPKAPREPADHSAFRVAGYQFIFHDEATTSTFSYDGRELKLSDLRGGQCGDRAIWTTKPWLRQ